MELEVLTFSYPIQYHLLITSRVGTGLAYLTQIALVASVGVAYTQWLWRTLSSTDLSIECVDEAFDADTAIISLLNREFITKVRVGAFLALLCWYVKLSDKDVKIN